MAVEAMAARNRLKTLLTMAWWVALVTFTFGSGFFKPAQAILLFGCCACAALCIRLHGQRDRPEGMVVVAAAIFFLISYVAQAAIFLIYARNSSATIGDLIGVRSIFSLAALGAGEIEVGRALLVVFSGFIGLVAVALWLKIYRSTKQGVRTRSMANNEFKFVVSNPLTIAYFALAAAVFFGALRKYFGLESAAPSGLPMGIGGVINIASSYIAPNLMFAAVFYALDHASDAKVKRVALLCVVLGAYNYILFTSKLSLIFPLLYLIVCQFLLRRTVVSMKSIFAFGMAFVLVYPFLNLYRAATALGVAPSDLIGAIADLYASQKEGDGGGIEQGAVGLAVAAIIGRFTGFDPLLILLQANPYPGTLLDYILYGDLDKYLTYEILDFQESMGYSPGFLGRYYYIFDGYVVVSLLCAATVYAISLLVGGFWRGGVRMRFMAPLALTYCIIFFTDGVRYEVVRSLVVSSVAIYGLIRLAGTVRIEFATKKVAVDS